MEAQSMDADSEMFEYTDSTASLSGGDKGDTKMVVKIFVGNIATGTDTAQLRELFEQHGVVKECDVLGGYGFVHMEDENVANQAIRALSGYSLNGSRLNVEVSTASTQGRSRIAARSTSTVKIFVGNLSKSTTNDKLRELFETYGGVSEADVLGGFGFVHMNNEQEAFKAIKALNGYILDGSRINVELSTGGTQGKSKDRGDGYSGRGATGMSRVRGGSVRYDPYPYPYPVPLGSRRSLDPHDSYGYQSMGSSNRGACDTYARDLLELYIKNPAAFDAYANDPAVRKSLNLPPLEADTGYYRNPGPMSSARDYYDRRRLSDMASASPSIAVDPYSSPSDFSAAAYDPMAMVAAAGRPWPGPGSSSFLSSYGGPGIDAAPHLPASAKGKGHLYTSFE